ncbi:hypothetical protein O181_087915 [Austropuccinia psidii MF-1]|uniref:Uncharacterized protein n=1 Tax=Austropuccinia psidii MF-1 TaxID=1389203 RepID=A0A9Q3IQT2_9BASI|nr:hypothetical protein [Austropuccinia psidii MF-1]
MLVMLANKHTRNVCLFSAPSDHAARGVLAQDTLTSTPLWLTMMKPYPSANGHWDLKQANGNDSVQLALSPQASICPPPLLGHHSMVTSLLDLSKVIIRLMKDGDGKRTFKLGPIVTNGIQTPKTKPPESPPKRLSHSQFALRANPTATHSRPKWHPMNPPKPKSHLFLARVHPPNHLRTIRLVSQNLRWLLRKPQRNLLVSHHFSFFTLLNFSSPLLRPSPARPATPRSIIIIDDTPVGSPPPTTPSPDIPPIDAENPTASSPPVPSSSHSYDDARQEFTDLRPILMIPRAIVHESINRILLEHRRLLHMIPFVDATHRNEMHREFREELNSLLGEAIEAYPMEDITGIVSKFLEK